MPEGMPADPFTDDQRFLKIAEHLQAAEDARKQEEAIWEKQEVNEACSDLSDKRIISDDSSEAIMVGASLRSLGYRAVYFYHRLAAQGNLLLDRLSRKAE